MEDEQQESKVKEKQPRHQKPGALLPHKYRICPSRECGEILGVPPNRAKRQLSAGVATNPVAAPAFGSGGPGRLGPRHKESVGKRGALPAFYPLPAALLCGTATLGPAGCGVALGDLGGC